MRYQLSIRAKLYACFGVVLAVAAISSVYSIAMARHLRNTTIQEMVSGATLLDETREISISTANMRISMRGVSLFTVMNHPEQVKKARAGFETSTAEVRKILEQIERNNLNSDD